mmetsp:Transcript_17121/g.52913  ORF Transcript_17121/g.52913 Transcript_17121/m.52913 type:complete len:149 (+) Transcript_17121:981-1427(+)
MRARPRGAWRRITLRRPPPSVASDTSTAIVTALKSGLATVPGGPREGSRTVGMDPMDEPMMIEIDHLDSEDEDAPADPCGRTYAILEDDGDNGALVEGARAASAEAPGDNEPISGAPDSSHPPASGSGAQLGAALAAAVRHDSAVPCV